MVAQSLLDIHVPEAEALVGPFRQRYDSSAAAGMPAHVTLLYPFLAPAAITSEVLDALRVLIAGHATFEFGLSRFGQFPGFLYLEPSPADPFRRLTEAIWARFPETPPYGGAFAEITPHLTIGHGADDAAVGVLAREVARAGEAVLPIRCRATEVNLVDNVSGRWETRAVFALAPTSEAGSGR
jgi:2'-5' RNA ligase